MTHERTKMRALLLDIEGTVTPISFVHDVLFPFARTHVREFLSQHFNTADVQEDILALNREHSLEREQSGIPNPVTSIESTVRYVNWLTDQDRKSPALKSLQGKIWEQGYREGTLKAPLFGDVVPNLRRLRRHSLKIAIFSSGSVLAQKLLFAHTDSGDHTYLIDHFFDTAVGNKMSAASYEEIARQLILPPGNIVFISDVTGELGAAREGGMEVLLSVRPGNPSQLDSQQLRAIHSFSEILPNLS